MPLEHRSIRTFLFVLSLILLCLMLATRSSQAQNFRPTRFTVIDAGTPGKPDVLLIPGLNSSRGVWDAEAKLLAPSYRLHLVQINGFAGQPAGANAMGAVLQPITEELHAYIAAGAMRPAIIGHSLGGLLALMLADKHPADVRKLVIVDALPFYALILSPDATVDNTRAQVTAMGDMLAHLSDEQYAASQTMVAMQLVKTADARKLVAAASGASDRAVGAKAMVEDMSTDLRTDLPGMKTPTLLLYPYDVALQGGDTAKVDSLYRSAYKPMPNVTLKRIDDSRHFIMYDQPAAFDTELEFFLK